MSVGQRIKLARKRMNLSQPDLAKMAGVAQSTISDIENDKKSPSTAIMMSISVALKTSIGYLLVGSEEGDEEKFVDYKKHGVGDLDQTPSNMVEIRYYEEIPVSCGFGSFGEILESASKTLIVNVDPLKQRHIKAKNCIALPAIGDSMFPTIKDKDIVYVDLSRTNIKDGKIFAIFHGGLFKFKRLYQLPLGGVRIVSDNSTEYPEERLTAQELIDQQFEIIGWAWSWQSMESW